MGERALSKFQWGIESTRGTAVAATRLIGAEPKAVPPDRVWEAVRLAKGMRVDRTGKRNDELLVRDTLSFAQGYFQMLPGLFQCCLDGTITPAEVNVGQSDYKWDVTPLLTAANDPDTLTIEMGDNVQAFEIEYCMFDSLKFSAEIDQSGGANPVKVEAGYFGRQVTPTTFTAAQVVHPSLEFMNAKLARLYMDTSWAGLGGTEQTSLLRGFEIEYMAANHPKFMGSANKYFTTHGEGNIGAMVTLTLEGIAGANSIYNLYQAGTDRALRLDINGSQIGSGATRLFRNDLYGYFESVVPLNSESNGNNLHQALFVAMPDLVGPNFIDIDVITDQNAI